MIIHHISHYIAHMEMCVLHIWKCDEYSSHLWKCEEYSEIRVTNCHQKKYKRKESTQKFNKILIRVLHFQCRHMHVHSANACAQDMFSDWISEPSTDPQDGSSAVLLSPDLRVTPAVTDQFST